MSEARCFNCKLNIPDLEGSGKLFVLRERNLEDWYQYLGGDHDSIQCPHCQTQTGQTPTIILALPNECRLFVQLGSLLKEEGFRKFVQGQDLPSAEFFAGKENLLREYQVVKRPRLGVLVHASQTPGLDFVRNNIQSLTPDIFLFGYLVVNDLIPGIGLAGQGGKLEIDEILSRFAGVQSRVFILIAEESERIVTGTSDSTFQSLMEEYVFNSPISSLALQEFERQIESINSNKQSPPLLSYCLEAVHAFVYFGRAGENPRRRNWTEQYMLFEASYRKGEMSESLGKCSIDPKLVAQTLQVEDVLDYIAAQLANPEIANTLHDIAQRLGYQDITKMIVGEGLHVSGLTQESLGDALDIFLTSSVPTMDPSEILNSSIPFFRQFLTADNPDEIDRFADQLEQFADKVLAKVGDNAKNRADVDTWLGAQFKEMRIPARTLQRIGGKRRDFENSLPPKIKVSLWNERSNALRLLGKYREALAVSQEVYDALTPELPQGYHRIAILNLAILMRENGFPSEAADMLRPLVSEARHTPFDFQERINILHSYIVTLHLLERNREILEVCEWAIGLATGPYKRNLPRLFVAKAGSLARLHQYEDAIGSLLQAGEAESHNYVDLVSELNTWVSVYANLQDISEDALKRINVLLEAIPSIIERCQEVGDALVHTGALVCFAQLTEILGGDDFDAWLDVVETCRYYEMPILPEALLQVAKQAYKDGDFENARNALCEVPHSVAQRIGGSKSPGELIDSTLTIESCLSSLLNIILLSDPGWQDIRLFAEISRDVVWRSHMIRTKVADLDFLNTGLSDESLRAIAPKEGSIAVVEFFGPSEQVFGIVTVIKQGGLVDTQWLDPYDDWSPNIGKEFHQRVSNWSSVYEKEPFEFAAWQGFETHVLNQLLKHVPLGSHIVFIDCEHNKEVPFHCIASEQWTSSYSSSWTELLAPRNNELCKLMSMGLGTALQAEESRIIVKATELSCWETERLCRDTKVPLDSHLGSTFDWQAFQTVMAECDIVKVICHGLLDSTETVSLILSANGQPPPSSSLATVSQTTKAFRVTIEDLETLKSVPSLLVLGACSGGTSHIGGLGDKIGIFSTLRGLGLSSMLAPRWDIEPEFVLPVLDQFLHNMVEMHMPIAKALHNACKEAESKMPRWLAWCLVLEGNWNLQFFSF